MRLPFSNPIDYLGIGNALACQKTKSATAPLRAMHRQKGRKMGVRQAVPGWLTAAKPQSGLKTAPGLDKAARSTPKHGCHVEWFA
jgi:hypothetical protein